MTQFGQLPRSGYLPDLIASEILNQITEGRLKPGDILPTETALAESFGVSRNVVREAIARLRSDGILDTKQGRGASVRPLSERTTLRLNVPGADETSRIEDLFELRAVLETGTVELAASRRTPEDLQEIQGCIDVFKGKTEFDEECLEADAEFHRKIGKATQNEYLGTIMDYLSGRLKETSRATVQLHEDSAALVEITINEHSAVLDAIRNQDRAAARSALLNHISSGAGRMGVQNLTTPEIPS